MTEKKILFIPAWYPDRNNPISGIFIKKHAVAAAKYNNIAVLFITFDPTIQKKNYHIDISNEDNVTTIRIYFNHSRFRFPILRSLVNIFFQYYLWIKGFKFVKKNFGKPQLIHVHVIPFLKTTIFPAPFLLGTILLYVKKIKKIPYIVTEHSSIYTDNDGRYYHYPYLFKRTVKTVFAQSEGITTVSENLMNSLKKHGIKHQNSFLISNVIDIPSEIKKNTSDKIRILTISILFDEIKNISGIIKAFYQVQKNFSNIELIIIGDGPDKNELIQLAKNLSLYNKNVFFEGFVPNAALSNYFFSSHFFILNSNFETFSVATAEAIAHGLPVIATKSGGPEEFITDEVGLLIERQNEKELVEAMVYMINNWKNYSPEKLRNYIAERFSADIIGKKLTEVYETILTPKK
jgi:glycosyltransferase involved in cell wall biosynthesis